MENNNNIRLVHEEAIKPDSLYTKKPLDWFIGRCVKIAFQSADSRPEHMWVQVTGRDGHNLVGILDNDPVVVTHLRCGDRIVLSRVQIEAVKLTWEEWWGEVEHLRAQNDFFNPWRGYPKVGNGFEDAYREGLTPRAALNGWLKWMPAIE